MHEYGYETLVHPREVFAEAIVDRATVVIIAHNHLPDRAEAGWTSEIKAAW
ncbi:MAG: hypothetical protein EA383_07185 [Spirochaetaceae bacterium]|nr:MAG: hypothetical protein EA383_07185 [Spirochaetaceae bacterium]